jgi:hypothetical protein
MSATPPRPTDQAVDRGPIRQKMTFLYADQQTGLDALARRLHDARSARGGERITANTLVRVLVDAAIAHGGRFHGDNEAELRESWMAFLAGSGVDA